MESSNGQIENFINCTATGSSLQTQNNSQNLQCISNPQELLTLTQNDRNNLTILQNRFINAAKLLAGNRPENKGRF